MTDKTTEAAALAALEQAKGALAKLPILGPALWLYARDPVKKFMFLGDTDWAVLPPIILDQCRLYTKDGLPYAFVTWALLDEAVAGRLRSAQPKIAPHEWKCGEEVWIIDAVAPFGQLEETLKELRETLFPGKNVHALLPDPARSGALIVREWSPVAPTTH
jgi:cytolysin-activating lysine-acyltransferase